MYFTTATPNIWTNIKDFYRQEGLLCLSVPLSINTGINVSKISTSKCDFKMRLSSNSNLTFMKSFLFSVVSSSFITSVCFLVSSQSFFVIF